MTNYQIIYNELVNREIMTAEKLDGFIARYGDIPFHTFKEWQKLGRQVKKGEKALFKVSLWRYGKKNVEVKTPEGEEKTEKLERYYMQDSHIFSFDQTEKKPTFKTRNADELREYNKMLADQRKQKAEQSKPEQTNLFTPEKVTTTATSRQAEPATSR